MALNLNVKAGSSVVIPLPGGDEIRVQLRWVQGCTASLGIEAPRHIAINHERSERVTSRADFRKPKRRKKT